MTDSIARTMPGTTPRNGLPETNGYVYRGTGRDVLTSGLSQRQLEQGAPAPKRPRRKTPAAAPAQAQAPAPAAPAGRCDECRYLTTAPGHLIACGGAS